MAKPQILCQLYGHAKQYDNDGMCHNKMEWWKLHGNISRNGYGNAMIGRYGGLCVIERIISRGLDAAAKFAPTLKVKKGNARYRRG